MTHPWRFSTLDDFLSLRPEVFNETTMLGGVAGGGGSGTCGNYLTAQSGSEDDGEEENRNAMLP